MLLTELLIWGYELIFVMSGVIRESVCASERKVEKSPRQKQTKSRPWMVATSKNISACCYHGSSPPEIISSEPYLPSGAFQRRLRSQLVKSLWSLCQWEDSCQLLTSPMDQRLKLHPACVQFTSETSVHPRSASMTHDANRWFMLCGYIFIYSTHMCSGGRMMETSTLFYSSKVTSSRKHWEQRTITDPNNLIPWVRKPNELTWSKLMCLYYPISWSAPMNSFTRGQPLHSSPPVPAAQQTLVLFTDCWQQHHYQKLLLCQVNMLGWNTWNLFRAWIDWSNALSVACSLIHAVCSWITWGNDTFFQGAWRRVTLMGQKFSNKKEKLYDYRLSAVTFSLKWNA